MCILEIFVTLYVLQLCSVFRDYYHSLSLDGGRLSLGAFSSRVKKCRRGGKGKQKKRVQYLKSSHNIFGPRPNFCIADIYTIRLSFVSK